MSTPIYDQVAGFLEGLDSDAAEQVRRAVNDRFSVPARAVADPAGRICALEYRVAVLVALDDATRIDDSSLAELAQLADDGILHTLECVSSARIGDAEVIRLSEEAGADSGWLRGSE